MKRNTEKPCALLRLKISNELCGGTHLITSRSRIIKIISEGSVASGIRRIEAVTAGFAERFIELQEEKAIEEIKGRINGRDKRRRKRAEETVNIINNRIETLLVSP